MRQSRDDSEGSASERTGNHVKSWIVGNWRSLTVLSAIVLMAFMLRVLFAYGTSAGSGFALSGGSDAAYHLHVIERILTTGGHVITDPALNYPFGGLNYNPPLFDWSVAILAFPLKLFGLSATEAASAALVFSTAIVGALTCIPVYLLTKEMFSRKVGIVAAAFFAISSVAIVKTVFSNGTESAYFVFFFVLTSLFLLKALKAFKQTEDKERSIKDYLFAPFNDKKVFRNMLFASLSLIALIYSWIGFIFVIMAFSAMMLVQVVLDRLRGKNAMSYVSIYGSVMLFSLLIGFLYYGLVMGMYTLIAGPLLLALLISVISFVIAHFRVWVITMPVCLAAAVVILLAISFMAPSLYAAMTSGFYPYADGKFGQLISAYSSVTLSTQAIYAGIVTMWFSFIVAAWRVFNVPKNADSKPYMFITMWFVAMILMSWNSIDLAYLAAPMYAMGAGVVIIWVLRRVHIKDYIASFKGCTIRTVWRKILKPVPFVAVLATVLMLLVPNMLYAVDASIPSNEKSNYNADMHLGNPDTETISYLGATNYYIKDSDWNMSKAWDYYVDKDKSGALVTWLDYGAEAAGKGNFQAVADHFGNGSSAASNMLLGSPQDALAVMIVRLLQTGDKATIDKAISDADMPSSVAEDLKRIIYDGKVPGLDASNRDYVALNSSIFGPTDANITDENAMYMVAGQYLKDNLTDGEISNIYNAVIDETGYEIGYIGVSGSMLPLYYGDNSLFSTMAYLNDYYLDRNAAPTKYYTAGIPYYGYYYTYTSAMYETMIWKALVGMTLEDYRALHNDPSLSFNTLIRGLMLSDGTYKAYPGYGLSNFGLDAWWVLYNPQADASGDWVLMDGPAAQAKQASDGGVINYLGGMAFLRYDEDCTLYDGIVETPSHDGVKGMTVAFYDAADPTDLKLIGTTKTNAAGRYGIMVSDDISISNVVVKVFSGPVNSMEVETDIDPILNPVSDGMTIEIIMADLNGEIEDLTTTTDVIITMTGSRSGMEYLFYPAAGSPPTFSESVVPDTYSVKISMNNTDLYSGTFTLYSGVMDVGTISVKTVAVTITVNDKYGNKVPGAEIYIFSLDDLVNPVNDILDCETDSSGIMRAKVSPGSYTVQLAGHNYKGDPNMLVSNSSTSATTSFTAKLGSSSTFTVVMVEATEVTIGNVVADDIITFTNGAYSWRGAYTATVIADSATAKIWLPTGDYGDASAYSAMKNSGGAISYAKVSDLNEVGTAASPWIIGTCVVEMTMTYGDDNEATAGMVSFIRDDGMMICAPIGIPREGDPTPTVKIPAGNYTVYAYANNLEKKAYLETKTISGNGTLDIKLEDARIISGTVNYAAQTTSSTSTKVTFVPVVVTVRDKAYTFNASTDALGSYYIMVPKSETYYTNTETFFGKMIGGHHMFMRALNNVSTTTTNTDTGRNILVIANYTQTDGTAPITYSVSGTVLRDLSNVWPGQTPIIEYRLGTGPVMTAAVSANGSYTISGILAGTTLEFTDLRHVDYSSDSPSLPSFRVTGTMTVDLTMSADNAAAAFVSGLVTDSLGNPLADVDVSYDLDTVAQPDVTTDANGVFKIPGLDPAGSHTLELTNLTLSDYAADPLPSPFLVSGSRNDIVLTMTLSATFPISGTVKDGSSGAALDGADVYYDLNGSPAGMVTTDPSGVFSITGISASDEIDITGVTRADYAVDTSLPSWTVGSSITDIEITMAKDDATTTFVSGRIVDDLGAPLSGVSVSYSITGATIPSTGTVLTDPNGVFRITDIVPGDDVEIKSIKYAGYKLRSTTPLPAPLSPASADVLPDFEMALDSTEPITIGGVTVTVTGTTTKTMVFKNTTDSVIYVYVRSDSDLTYSSTKSKEWTFSLSAQGTRSMTADASLGIVEITVVSNIRPVVIKTDAPVDLVDSDIEVKQSGSVMEPDLTADPTGRTYNLTTGYYELTIRPKSTSAGDTAGYYYSGPMRVFADIDTTTPFNVTDLVAGITVVEFIVKEGDKVSVSGTGWSESSASDLTHKIYFMPTDRLDEYTATVSNDKQIGYIDLGTAPSSSIDTSKYMGDKITVSGYVGRTVDGTMKISMTSFDGSDYYIGTATVPIIKGEYTATLPKVMGDPAKDITYEFFATVNDSSKGTFTEGWQATGPLDITDGKAIVNMEVALSLSSAYPVDYVEGTVTDTSYSYPFPVAGATVEYTIDGKEGKVITNAGGHYLIMMPSSSSVVDITKATKTGYADEILTIFSASGPGIDFTMTPNVPVEQQPGIVFTQISPTLIKVDVTMNVTNGHGSTMLLFPNKAWITPTFKVDGGASANYAVIPNDALVHTVDMVAYYDPTKVGAGSSDLSITVKDLLGTTLQTKVLDSDHNLDVKGNSADLDVTPEGNRVSKDEYGYAATFKNTTGNWVEVTLSIGGTVPAGWFASIVDADNVILEDLTVLIPGNSVKTYYVRLMSEGEVPNAMPEGFTLEYDDGSSGVQTVPLNMDPTSLTVNGQTVAGDNIYESMNGMPDIVWALIALIVLTALLIFWLGMRRGVFTRKR